MAAAGLPGRSPKVEPAMLRTTLVTLMLAAVATVAAADTVYKWVDARGQVHYTDLPPREAGARLLSTIERGGMVDEDLSDEPPAPAADTLPAGFGEADAPDGETRAAAVDVQRDLDAKRGEQCKQARTRYTQYIESRRLYRQTADGKREYLSEAELAKARVDAKRDVDEYCGPGTP
jgi:hypothetical protein